MSSEERTADAPLLNSSPAILVIDDDEGDCCLVEDILAQENLSVTSAVGGAAGIKLLGRQNFDVVITDLKMPDVDGFGILDYLARNRPETVVIVISGFASIDSVIKALRQGAYDYITKPFTPELLVHSLRRALDYLELRRSRLKAESFAMVSQMACTAAHEVFQPLTVLMGLTHEIARAHAEAREQTDGILEQARAIRAIITRMENLNAYIVKTMPGGHTIIDLEQASAAARNWPPAD
ncbi:MAG: Cell cycle response regulator CtrA [Deltaproteobacteria bacterium ADurb.Bin510]|nr:MAG: Cell cycle response regulator CtrA [Deltaproteobacteria bacterium ADurb.Bin510]